MPNNFILTGRVVHHTARPRFSATFVPRSDGGLDGTDIKFVDSPPPNAQTLARLMREAGDYFAANVRADWIQRRVADRARELNLTAYAIAKATGGAVSEDHVRDYLTARKSCGSHKLQHVLRVLRLDVTPEK